MSEDKYKQTSSDTFKVFAASLTRAIKKNKKLGTTQKDDLENLIKAEKHFIETLKKSERSQKVFSDFIHFIRLENGNILSARPYLRESSKSFSKYVTPHLKIPNPDALADRNFNILFAKWVKERWRGSFPRDLEAAYQEIETIRTRLIEDNMPLAINQAKIFFRKVPLSSVEFNDMIGWCAAGLASGIDKWARDEWDKVFRTVCLGRMKGNLIDAYSKTMIHFYPQDQRILYKANALRFRLKIEDFDELAAAVNKSFKEDAKEGVKPIGMEITGSQLMLLMSASSHVGAETSATTDETYTVYNTTPDEESLEDTIVHNDLMNKTKKATKALPIIQRKIVRLKGGLD